MTTTPEQFLALLTGSQEERDAAEPVALVEGHIGLTRSGSITGILKHYVRNPQEDSENVPDESYSDGCRHWHPDGEAVVAPRWADIISCGEPSALRAAAIDSLSKWGQDHQGVEG